MVNLIYEAQSQGANIKTACQDLGLSQRSIQRWKKDSCPADRRKGASKKVYGKLTEAEELLILQTCNSKEYRNLNPCVIVQVLLSKGLYLASERTFYRILKKHGQLAHRGISRTPVYREKPAPQELTGPGQLWSWDITYLKSNIIGSFFYLYLFMDVWSRKILHAAVSTTESSQQGALIMEKLAKEYEVAGIRLHSDNGAAMKGSTMLATLYRLGILPSFSRPRVSEDNPFSESLFKTMKYRGGYPGQFESAESAQAWVDGFVGWYNLKHLHSQIGYVTPSGRHEGSDIKILETRSTTIQRAWETHPSRWKGRTPRTCFPNRSVSFLTPKRSEPMERQLS